MTTLNQLIEQYHKTFSELKENFIPVLLKQVKSLDDLKTLFQNIPEKKSVFIRYLFDEYKSFAHVLHDIAKNIKTAQQLMELCNTIPEKKSYFIRCVLNQVIPFEHVLSDIAKETDILTKLIELCRYFPEEREQIIKLVTSEMMQSGEALLNEINNLATIEQSEREMIILQLASAIGCMDKIKSIEGSCGQAWIAQHADAAYRLSAHNGHVEVMNYLKENALDQIQKTIESGLDSIFLTAVQKGNAEVVQHLLFSPVVQTYAIGYCNGEVHYPNGGVKVFKFPQSPSHDQTFLREQLDIFYQNKLLDKENVKNTLFGIFIQHLGKVASEAIIKDETSLKSVNNIKFGLLKLLAEFKDDKKTLDELKQESKNLLDMWRKSYAECSAAAWLSEQIFAALRIFFHACDRLQSVATGDMIDKSNRHQLFSKSLREKSIEMIQNISNEFVVEINKLETEFHNKNLKSGPLKS